MKKQDYIDSQRCGIHSVTECTLGNESVCNELNMVIRKRVTFEGLFLTMRLKEIHLPFIILKRICN